jgi:hypothetical protein
MKETRLPKTLKETQHRFWLSMNKRQKPHLSGVRGIKIEQLCYNDVCHVVIDSTSAPDDSLKTTGERVSI